MVLYAIPAVMAAYRGRDAAQFIGLVFDSSGVGKSGQLMGSGRWFESNQTPNQWAECSSFAGIRHLYSV